MNNNLIGNVFLTMAVTNSIFNHFSKKTIDSKYINSLDNAIMNADEESVFNTYRYWTPFQIPMQNVIKDGSSKDDKGNPEMESTSTRATKSLFNNFNAVYVSDAFRKDANMPLLDNPESRKDQRANTACTIKDLVEASLSGAMGRQVYNYSDFAYCKYLGKISNNYLITLRRFGAPCGDRIDKRTYSSIRWMDDQVQNHMPDIGRMITWLGTPGNEMSNILKYSYSMNWEDQEAKIEEIESDGEGSGKLASIFNMANSKYRTQVQKGMAGKNFSGKSYIDGMFGGIGSTDPPYDRSKWDRMYDSTKIYGPLDVIMKTKKRKEGLTFEQKITLTFDYELRSYYGVNGKAAMADLLGNILATTYTHGTFWGGERRFVGGAQDNVFANLGIFNLADEGGLNNPGSVWTALMYSIHQGAQAFTGGVKGETTVEKIKNLAKDIGGMLLGGVLNKLGRPQKFAMASLLSGAPVGCWHLTVGNPKSPIIEVGNLVCTSSEIEHYGPLGLDDFPTGLRVRVTLEHGKPRDIVGIEQMYGRGDTRIYAPLGENVMNMYETAESISSPRTISGDEKTAIKLNESYDSLKLDLDPTDILDANINLTQSKEISNTKSPNKEDITSLMRYFGTEERNLIVAAGGEALYGSEKHKNDHLQKPAAGKGKKKSVAEMQKELDDAKAKRKAEREKRKAERKKKREERRAARRK